MTQLSIAQIAIAGSATVTPTALGNGNGAGKSDGGKPTQQNDARTRNYLDG